MRNVVWMTGLVLCLSGPTFAQGFTPAVEVSGGYSFLRDDDLDENLHGWVASAAGTATKWLSIVGEVGGNYKTVDVFGTDFSFSIHSFMGGPRVSARLPGSVTPFGQVLVGGVRGTVSVLGESDSSTEFGLQLGGGVDFWVRPRLGLRIGADYRRVFIEEAEEGLNEFRFHAGIVLGVGTR